MLGKQTPLQKVRGTAKRVLGAEEAERLSSPSLQLANFPLLFLGHLLSPRYPKESGCPLQRHIQQEARRGQWRAVLGTPFSHLDVWTLALFRPLFTQEEEAKRKTQKNHTHRKPRINHYTQFFILSQSEMTLKLL